MDEAGTIDQKLTEMNNFWLYLPGGHYRQQTFNAGRVRLVRDLDILIRKMGFDARTYHDEISVAEALVAEALNLPHSQEQERKFAEAAALDSKARRKLVPLYEAMRKLGYRQDILTQ